MTEYTEGFWDGYGVGVNEPVRVGDRTRAGLRAVLNMGCVVPDPRLIRIKTLLTALEAETLSMDGGYVDGALSVIEQVREAINE